MLVFQNNLRNLVMSGRYDTKEDFTVVMQPFFNTLQIPVQEVCTCHPIVSRGALRGEQPKLKPHESRSLGAAGGHSI